MIKVAGVQIDVLIGDKAANLARLLEAAGTTASSGAQLTVFPECALTGYCFDSREEALALAEPIPGPATEQVARFCQASNRHIVFGMLEKDGDRCFNACVLVGPAGVMGSYRKIHLPYLGVDRFTAPGDRPFSVCTAGDMRVGMNICYDASFPEPARILALEGADLIVLPTNWPPGAECTADCVINARALENQVYYMAVNRIGTERGFRFIGNSRICAPDGSTLAEAQHTSAAVLYADIDVEWARNKHIIRVPGKHEIDRFADRRPEMYSRICQQ